MDVGQSHLRRRAFCGVDIGGTLAKLVYIRNEEEFAEEPNSDGGETDTEVIGNLFASPKKHGRTPSLNIPLQGGGTLCFEYFQTGYVDELITFIKDHHLLSNSSFHPLCVPLPLHYRHSGEPRNIAKKERSLLEADQCCFGVPEENAFQQRVPLSAAICPTSASVREAPSLSVPSWTCSCGSSRSFSSSPFPFRASTSSYLLPDSSSACSSQSLPATLPMNLFAPSGTSSSSSLSVSSSCTVVGDATEDPPKYSPVATRESPEVHSPECLNSTPSSGAKTRDIPHDSSDVVLAVTGGGAYKFSSTLRDHLHAHLNRQDEMQSIMRGLSYLLQYTDSIFKFDLASHQRIPVDVSSQTCLFPFLVINIGSGVSMLKAEGPNKFVRVSGTCIGGGTVMGLAKLLFGAKSFDEVIKLSEAGTDCLDLTVADLLGDAAGSTCLPANTLATSFGRVYTGQICKARREDLARSLVHMVSYNLGYLAYLVATAHRVRRLVFAGKYVNNSSIIMESITHGVQFYIRHYYERLRLKSYIVDKKKQQDDGSSPTSSVSYSPSTHTLASPASKVNLKLSPSADSFPSVGPSTKTSCQLPDLAQEDENHHFDVLFVRHDGYLGALGCLLADTYSS